MRQVIYGDVLVIINVFITYGLLRLTGIICRSEKRQLLFTLSCFLAGLYSLVVIIPGISDFAVALSRLPVCVVLIVISFRINNLRHFLRLFAAFLAVNFVFAGLMFALWYFIAPTGMYFNNGIVYFNINIEMLAVLICICYFVTLVLSKLIAFKSPVNTLYELTVFLKDKSVNCNAFLDTGNKLRDAFTSYPVIVMNKQAAQPLFDCEISCVITSESGVPVFRPIFCSTVSGENMLLSFKPDKVRIRGVNCDFECDKVYIALTQQMIKNGEYNALLASEIFQNKTNEKGDYYFSAFSQKHIGEAEAVDPK